MAKLISISSDQRKPASLLVLSDRRRRSERKARRGEQDRQSKMLVAEDYATSTPAFVEEPYGGHTEMQRSDDAELVLVALDVFILYSLTDSGRAHA